jgi:DNA-binding NarL/FixJ family response regulator
MHPLDVDREHECSGRTAKIRAFVAHSVPLVAESLRVALAQQPDFDVVGVQTDPRLSADLIGAQNPHVVLLEALPGAPSVISSLQESAPATRVIIVVGHEDIDVLAACIAAGAVGCLTGPAALRMRVQTVRYAYDGWAVLTSDQVARLLNRQRMSAVDPTVADRCASLSARERDVLQAFALGVSTDQAARHLSISANTVRSHLASAERKLGVSSKLAAVMLALRAGIINLPTD